MTCDSISKNFHDCHGIVLRIPIWQFENIIRCLRYSTFFQELFRKNCHPTISRIVEMSRVAFTFDGGIDEGELSRLTTIG